MTDVGSAEILGLFRSGVGLFGSSLMTAELLRVATRNQLSYTSAERILRRMRLLSMDDSLLREAGQLKVPNAWVRTADAIHIITATRLEQTDFVTYDRVQARGAEAMGFVVRSPGLEGGWR